MPSGSCMCGAVKYKVKGEPPMKAVCHCPTCRKVTGSTYLTSILVPDADFECDTSVPELRTYKSKQVPTGMPMERAFCSNCGITLFKTAAGWPGNTIVFAGTLDDEDALEKAKPMAEFWTKYRVGWVDGIDGEVMQCEEFPPN